MRGRPLHSACPFSFTGPGGAAKTPALGVPVRRTCVHRGNASPGGLPIVDRLSFVSHNARMVESWNTGMSSSEDDEVDEAMKALTRIFCDPKLTAKAHFRCRVEGPTEIDELLESIMDETFGPYARSRYKRWVGRLYRLDLIPKVPAGWVDNP